MTTGESESDRAAPDRPWAHGIAIGCDLRTLSVGLPQEGDLTEWIAKIARAEWDDPESVTAKNRRSIPSDLMGFVVIADMGGVLMLDADGRFRVFLHDGGEIALEPWMTKAAWRELDRRYPELAQRIRRDSPGA